MGTNESLESEGSPSGSGQQKMCGDYEHEWHIMETFLVSTMGPVIINLKCNICGTERCCDAEVEE